MVRNANGVAAPAGVCRREYFGGSDNDRRAGSCLGAQAMYLCATSVVGGLVSEEKQECEYPHGRGHGRKVWFGTSVCRGGSCLEDAGMGSVRDAITDTVSWASAK